MDRLLLSRHKLLLLVGLLVLIDDGLCACPPASGMLYITVSCVICHYFTGMYLMHDGNCYSNGSYFWDSSVNAVTEAISCVLPGTSLSTGQWVRVADPDDDPVDCNSNSASDPFRCTSVTSPATLNLYLAQGLPADQEGWYKCCLPTDCSDPNTNIIFANIFSKRRL